MSSRCKQSEHCINKSWCATTGRCLKTEPNVPEASFVNIDCRLCLNYQAKFWPGRCGATVLCIDGKNFNAGQPVQLWEHEA